MKRLFEGEVYDTLPQPSGVVFSYCKDKEDELIRVSYKMLSLENDKMTDVAKNIYLLSKFGSNYRNIIDRFENHITTRTIAFSNGKVFALKDNGMAYLFSAEGDIIWEGIMLYRGNPPSDIAFHKGAIWATFSQANVMIKYNMVNMKPEIRIGGSRTPFSNPKEIFLMDDYAIVSNPNINKLLRVNLNNYEVSDYKTFSEPVYSYTKIRDSEFVVMKSGLYQL